MLKLKSISRAEKIKNESDFYIKIKILFNNDNLNWKLYYWSCIYEDSLIEIGIKQENGAIHEITVLPAKNILNDKVTFKTEKIIERMGLPLFETGLWENKLSDSLSEKFHRKNYYRESMKFNVYSEETNVLILFLHNEIELKVINGPVGFYFDKDNFLCAIKINGMRLNEEGFLESLD
ncbi:hypothetical protein ACFLYH_03290 [Candidatus Dependentiae bacterium]